MVSYQWTVKAPGDNLSLICEACPISTSGQVKVQSSEPGSRCFHSFRQPVLCSSVFVELVPDERKTHQS